MPFQAAGRYQTLTISSSNRRSLLQKFGTLMESRRDFLKKAALLAAAGGLAGVLPASIQRAFAIDPVPGSTYLDAEHIVILMQENRSFDQLWQVAGRARFQRSTGNDPAKRQSCLVAE